MKQILLLFLIILNAGCSAKFHPSSAKHTPIPYLKPNSIVFVEIPVIQDSIEKVLEEKDWTADKFCKELRSELIFQLKRHKIKATTDSNLTANSLTTLVDSYSINQAPNYTQLKGYTILLTSKGRRIFKVIKGRPLKGAMERSNNTLDNIRFIAEGLASQLVKPPKKKKREPVYEPQMWIIF
jgi:hypothetical protein